MTRTLLICSEANKLHVGLSFFSFTVRHSRSKNNRELKQPRWRRRQKCHKFAYFTMKNGSFARFARAFFIFVHFAAVIVLCTTWNDTFCSYVDDVGTWWQIFQFFLVRLSPSFFFFFPLASSAFPDIRSVVWTEKNKNLKKSTRSLEIGDLVPQRHCFGAWKQQDMNPKSCAVCCTWKTQFPIREAGEIMFISFQCASGERIKFSKCLFTLGEDFSSVWLS